MSQTRTKYGRNLPKENYPCHESLKKMTQTTIALASDHAGFALKSALRAWLEQKGHRCLDLGTDSDASVDYPDYGHELARTLIAGKAETGIALCGSGIGISIAANRHAGIRAALCHNPQTAALSRAHNDANVLVLAARTTDEATAKACITAFLSTPFEGGRHQTRVEKLG